MRAGSSTSSLAAAAVMGLAALGLTLAPAEWGDAFRTTVHDALLPGHRVVQSVGRWAAQLREQRAAAEDHTTKTAALQSELAQARLNCRRLEVENAALWKQWDESRRSGSGAWPSIAAEPLLVPELVEASVLGSEDVELLRSGLLVDRGAWSGLTESALVLEGTQPLLDQGEAAGLRPGQPVCAGRTVLGRVERVGRWVSRVRGVTDPAYRDFVQLARRTSEGLVFGARGLLRGQGKRLCRLEHIGAAEPVSVGDEVYSVPPDEALAQPLYYGRIVAAELADGGTHWRIQVEPAADSLDTRTVQVLRKTINPARLLAN